MNNKLIEALTREITEAQMIVDDTENMGWDCYSKANARSFIRGIKMAIKIIEENS